MNHKRLDAVLSWAPQLKVDNTCAAEFEALRRLSKQNRAQARRAKHLEKHMDLGDLVCDCYEKVRRDIIE